MIVRGRLGMRSTASGGSPVSWDSRRRRRSLAQDKSRLLAGRETTRPFTVFSERGSRSMQETAGALLRVENWLS